MIAFWDDAARAREWAARYVQEVGGHNVHLHMRNRRTLELLDPEPRGLLLDVGCGSGELAGPALEMGFAYLGIDAAEAMLQEARAKWRDASRASFRLGDIEALPLPDDSVDAVACLGVLGYMADRKRSVREICRVLKPGGAVVVSNQNRLHVDTLMTLALRPLRILLSPVLDRLRGVRWTYPTVWAIQPSELDALMAEGDLHLADFALLHFTPVPYPFRQLLPRLAHAVNTRFEDRYHRRLGMRFWAHGYVGKYRKG
jgi:2-polyprenyl-3-methyl-5-hydroxy-6-metoxy-1,4-benzoquinol methylase